MDNEIKKECESFIKSGAATKVVKSGNFYTTYIDPYKIAEHFVNWQKQRTVDEFKKVMYKSKDIWLNSML